MIDLRTSEEIRLDAWRSVFERANRIVAAEPVTVQIKDGAIFGMDDVPGWTDGNSIVFNQRVLIDMLKTADPVSSVLRLKGLNYHELSHVLFTPRADDSIVKTVMKQNGGGLNLWYAFNALEDQRIETAFSAMYSPSRRYFEAMALEFLLKKGTVESAILLHGRKYLDPKVRVHSQAAFEAKYGADLFKWFADVIDNYLSIQLPTNSVMALSLIRRFAELVKEMQARGGQTPQLPVDDHQDGGQIRAGKPMSRADQKRVVAQVKKVVAKASKDDDKARQDAAAAKAAKANPTDASSQDDGATGDDGGQDGDGAQAGDDQGGSQGQTGDGDASDGAGAGGGDGTGDSSADSPGDGAGLGSTGGAQDQSWQDDALDALKDLLAAAEDGLDDISSDAKVQNDAQAVLDAVKAVENNGRYDAKGDKIRQGMEGRPASPEDVKAHRKVTGVIQQIRAVAEPEILRGQASGRVDVRRALMRSKTDTDIFVRYDEGALDSTGMEVVMLMDVSGSMHKDMGTVNSVLWCMKRSFDRLDIPCTVILYEDGHHVMYRARDKAAAQVPCVGTMGGTEPTSALREALNILSKSHEPNKVLITVTDGAWMTDPDQEAALMRGINNLGATTMLLGLRNAVKQYGSHHHQIGHDLQSVALLPKAVTKLVTQIMRKAILNV